MMLGKKKKRKDLSTAIAGVKKCKVYVINQPAFSTVTLKGTFVGVLSDKLAWQSYSSVWICDEDHDCKNPRQYIQWACFLQTRAQSWTESLFDTRTVCMENPHTYIHTYMYVLKIRVVKNIYKICEQTPIMYMSSILTDFFQVCISVGWTNFFFFF